MRHIQSKAVKYQLLESQLSANALLLPRKQKRNEEKGRRGRKEGEQKDEGRDRGKKEEAKKKRAAMSFHT